MRTALLAGLGLLLLTMIIGLVNRGGAADDGVRRIVYWEKWGGFEGEAIQQVVDRFNEREREKAASDQDYRPWIHT